MWGSIHGETVTPIHGGFSWLFHMAILQKDYLGTALENQWFSNLG